MSNLNKEEIVLLNCFNYLNVGNKQDEELGEVVNYIFNKPNEFERLTANKPAAMGAENWKEVLERIKNDKKLSSLIIRKQSQFMGYDTKGLNAICFLDEETKKATFVFRGTGSGEWLDNGLAFAENDSPQQLEALQYFERSVKELKLQEKGYVIDVSGHSKGGNKAQFITINSDIVNKCYSFDGQGFSKEALEKYKDKIQKNSYKITSIAANDDYVHPLGNEIAGEKVLFKTKYIKFEYPYNHCPDAILNKNGGLTEKVQNEPWQNVMINDYSRYLMELNPDMKKEVFTSFMGLAQMTLGKDTSIGRMIPSYDNAKKALLEASVEFQNWFKQDRNQFTFGQKIALATLGTPIIKLGLPLIYKVKYNSFEKLEGQIFGTLKKDINKEFAISKDIMVLEKVFENSKKDLENIQRLMEKDIGIRPSLKLETVEKEILCQLKAKDELNFVFVQSKNDKIKEFCKEQLKEVDINIENLDKSMCENGELDKLIFDNNIVYLKEKVIDYKRYMSENNLLNDINKEEEIKDIVINTLEEMNPVLTQKLKDINQLYNAEKKLAELRKENAEARMINDNLKELQKEKAILNTVKEKLVVLDKYKPIVDTYNSKILFKKSYRDKHSSEIQNYNKAKKYLDSMKINNWDDYRASKNIVNKKETSIVGSKNMANLDAFIKRGNEINKYKNSQIEIMKKYCNPIKLKSKSLSKGLELYL